MEDIYKNKDELKSDLTCHDVILEDHEDFIEVAIENGDSWSIHCYEYSSDNIHLWEAQSYGIEKAYIIKLAEYMD